MTLVSFPVLPSLKISTKKILFGFTPQKQDKQDPVTYKLLNACLDLQNAWRNPFSLLTHTHNLSENNLMNCECAWLFRFLLCVIQNCHSSFPFLHQPVYTSCYTHLPMAQASSHTRALCKVPLVPICACRKPIILPGSRQMLTSY